MSVIAGHGTSTIFQDARYNIRVPRFAPTSFLQTENEATMSEESQGPGWWQAADLKWYPPELHADYVAPGPSNLTPPPNPPPPAAASNPRPVIPLWKGLGIAVAACVGVYLVLVVGNVIFSHGSLHHKFFDDGPSPSSGSAGSNSGANKIIVNGQTLDMGQGEPRVHCYGARGTETLNLRSASGQPRVEIDLANEIYPPDSPMKVRSVTIVVSGHTLTALMSEDANGEEGTKAKFVQHDRNWTVTGYVTGESLDHTEPFEVDVTCP
jgi:Mycobacterium 19 kDa lipoprotein antigen